jgi:uncharacterized membrane protein
MVEFEIDIQIHKPVETVLEAFLDPDNMPYYTTDLEKVEIVKEEPGLVGSVMYLHYKKKGRSYIMEDKLEYAEHGKKYISQVSGDALTARVEIGFHVVDPGKTKMNLCWSGKGKVLFLKLFLPFLRRKIIYQARHELEKFRELIETTGSDFSKGKGDQI